MPDLTGKKKDRLPVLVYSGGDETVTHSKDTLTPSGTDQAEVYRQSTMPSNSGDWKN